MRKTICSFFFLFFILSSLGFTQNVDYAKLNQMLAQTQQQFSLPGMAVAIVKDGDVVFQQGYGFRDVEAELRVTPNTNFAIASISKAFCATAIAMLVEQGKLDWNDKVIDHLPYFRLHDPVITQLITVEDLLCHRSGFDTFDGDLLTYGTNYTPEEALRRLAALPLKHEFRHYLGYNNLMFIAAGEIIKAVSGKDWFAFVNDEIFKPLGMQKSVTSITQFTDKSEVALPYVHGKKDEVRNYDNWSSSASINSNLGDMSRWISMWLNNGAYGEDARLISEASYKKILSPHIYESVSNFHAENKTHFKGYGLGWFLRDYQGVKVAEHGGGLPGYISKICIVPELNLGFIVLTNGESYAPEAIMYHLLDLFILGKPTKDWPATFKSFADAATTRKQAAKEKELAARVLKTTPSHKNDAYVGIYEDKMYGEAEIKLAGNQLNLTLLPTKKLFTANLKHWHYNTFQFQFADPFLPEGFITFETNFKGEISGFSIELPNPDFNFYNLHFERKN